jgi:hypothetical protein
LAKPSMGDDSSLIHSWPFTMCSILPAREAQSARVLLTTRMTILRLGPYDESSMIRLYNTSSCLGKRDCGLFVLGSVWWLSRVSVTQNADWSRGRQRLPGAVDPGTAECNCHSVGMQTLFPILGRCNLIFRATWQIASSGMQDSETSSYFIALQ